MRQKKIKEILSKVLHHESTPIVREITRTHKIIHRNLPLSHQQVHDFELEYKINLPEEYKSFLLIIGNGGFGGLNGLPIERNDKELMNHYNNASKRFPYENHIFISDFDEFLQLIQYSYNPIKEFVNIDEARSWYQELVGKRIENQSTLFGLSGFYEGNEFKEWLFNEYQFSINHFNGTIPISENNVLVVSGKLQGTIWVNCLAHKRGAYPRMVIDNRIQKFSEFAEEWIDEYFLGLKKSLCD